MDREEYLRKKRESGNRYRKEHPEKVKESKRKYHSKNKEKIAAKSKGWRQKNPELFKEGMKKCRAAKPELYKVAEKRWREENKEYIRKYKLSKRGIIPTRERPEICEICQLPPRRTVLVADHCHETGQFRGWLCHRCNLVLGSAKDDILLLRKLAEYLEMYDKKLVE